MLQTCETHQNYGSFPVCVCVCDRITHYHETKGITNFTELKQTTKIRDPENDITIEIM